MSQKVFPVWLMSDCFLSKMNLAPSPACSPITLITHFELTNAFSSSVMFLSWSLKVIRTPQGYPIVPVAAYSTRGGNIQSGRQRSITVVTVTVNCELSSDGIAHPPSALVHHRPPVAQRM
jgi:hypothetical protein